MDLNKVREFLGDDWKRVEDYIKGSLKSDIELLDFTNNSILSNSGKQLRPLMAILSARACNSGCCSDASYRFAAASELLHNATLLHDDVADNSDRRRGVPTVLSLLGASASVLVGDYWLVQAVKLVLDSDDESRAIKAVKAFSATLCALAEGEMLQLQKANNCDTTEEDYLRIIYNKTASLFETSMKTAAISVDAPAEYQDAVCKYAVALGLAFQIKDDILDYAPSCDIGKPTGVDVTERKITLPLLGAIHNSNEGERIRALMCTIDTNPQVKDEIIEFVRVNKGTEYAQQSLNKYIDEALTALEVLPESEEKSYLIQLAYFVGERTL